MASKLSFLAGFGTGYVLGARSGRERYEEIAEKAQRLWHDPRVQEKAGQAQQVVQDKAGQAGQVVKEKVASATSSDEGAPGGAPDVSPVRPAAAAGGTGASGTSATSASTSGGKLP